MILLWLIIIPMVGGVLSWLLSHWNDEWARWVALAALVANLALVAAIWAPHFGEIAFATRTPWLMEFNLGWIPQLGISFHLALDGLSLLLVALTSFVGLGAVATSWHEIRERVGLFHFNLLWALSGITGVFLASDLFLFYFFWEMMLVPTYFLFFWGYERRIYAAVKFFLFTQGSGLFMLLAILGLYFVHGHSTGNYTFDYGSLLATSVPASIALLFLLGFFVAFAVKLPVVPFHTWLPDAYTEAPTAATVILAALMAKTGGYGLLRFVVPMFPDAARTFAPAAMALGVAGILYGALLAFAQTDLKRIIAYSSISHMGFVLLGIFAFNEWALQGAVMQMIAHGVSTGAIFMLAGILQQRVHTREIGGFGALWSSVPRISGAFLIFSLALLGLPGLGNFVGEFLVLVGTFRTSVLLAVLGALGMIGSVIYALRMVQGTLFGSNSESRRLADFSVRELAVMAAMVAAIFWLGLYPQPVLSMANQTIVRLQRYASTQQAEIPSYSLNQTKPLWMIGEQNKP